MRGINLTMPHKVAVIPYLDSLTEAAKVIGAVNTIICRPDGTLFGENADGKGSVQSLSDVGIALDGKRICLLGALHRRRVCAGRCRVHNDLQSGFQPGRSSGKGHRFQHVGRS